MTIENITENANIAAVGRILTPGKKITMPVEYYASKKHFINEHVLAKRAEITGMEEYEAFIGGKIPKIVATKDAEPIPVIKTEAKAEAEAEAKAKAEAEAKAKAEAEAKAKAEAEAKAKAEAEAKAKAEAEAKAKAEAEAKAKAEAEAKAKATTSKAKAKATTSKATAEATTSKATAPKIPAKE